MCVCVCVDNQIKVNSSLITGEKTAVKEAIVLIVSRWVKKRIDNSAI